MSNELEKILSPKFPDFSLAQPAVTRVETDEGQPLLVEERKTVYRAVGSPGWLGAALGTQSWPVAPDKALTLPQTEDLGDSAPAPQQIHPKGGEHG